MARLLVKKEATTSIQVHSGASTTTLDTIKKEDQLQLIMSVNIHFVTTFSSFLLLLAPSSPTISFQLSQLYVLLLYEARVNGHLSNTI